MGDAVALLAAHVAVACLRIQPLLTAALGMVALQRAVLDRTARAMLLLSVPLALDTPVHMRTDYRGYDDAFVRPILPVLGAVAAAVQMAPRGAVPDSNGSGARALALTLRTAAAATVAPVALLVLWLAYTSVAQIAHGGNSRRSMRLLGAAVRVGLGAPSVPPPASPCFYAVNYPRTILAYAAAGLFEGDVSVLASESNGWRIFDCPIVFQPQGCKYTELREILRAELERGRSVVSFAEYPWGGGAVQIRRSTLFAAQDLGVPVIPVYVHWPAHAPLGVDRVRVVTGAPFAVRDTDQQARHLSRFWWRTASRIARGISCDQPLN